MPTVFRLALRPLVFLLFSLLSTVLHAQTLDWDLGAADLAELESRSFDSLFDEAVTRGVPVDEIRAATELLFDESKPTEVPDEMIAKKRMYALILAQEKIIATNPLSPEKRPEAEVRASAIEAVEALGCEPAAKGGGPVQAAVREFTAPMGPELTEAVYAYSKALEAFGRQLDADLASLDQPATAEDKEDVERLLTEADQMTPRSMPQAPDYAGPARAEFEALGKSGQASVEEALRAEALAGFSCAGSACSSCTKTVAIEYEEAIGEQEEPLISVYRVKAVPQCTCGG